MAFITEYANYTVYFTDQAEYDFAVGIAGGASILLNPQNAAAMFGLTYPPPGGPLGAKGFIFYFPFTIGTEIGFPAPSGVFMDGTIDFMTVPGQAGVPASIFPAGPDLHLYWSCGLILMGTGAAPSSPTRAPVPKRRWAIGFEYQDTAEAGTGGQNLQCRDSSRVFDSMGWGLRNSINVFRTFALNTYGTPATDTKSWERFYMRVRTFGAITIDIWKTQGNPSPLAGGRIDMDSSGNLICSNVTSAGVVTTLFTIPNPFVLNIWVRIDVIVEYNPLGAGGNGRLRVYVNGVLGGSATVAPGSGGLGVNNQHHQATLFGTQLGSANSWEIDFDDYHNAEVPNVLGVEQLDSIDWLLGTHIKRQWVLSGTSVNWTGQVQSMNQMMNPTNTTAGSRLISTTALAQLVGLTDADPGVDATGPYLAACAAIISCYTQLASGAVAGRLGYSLAGGGQTFPGTIVESVAGRYNNAMYSSPGTEIIPAIMAPFSIIYEKANTAVSATLFALACTVQYIGSFGFEDSPDALPYPTLSFLHNCWYPFAAYALLAPVTNAPVYVKGGTYVGNGTTTTVSLPAPCHFLWIRPLTGGAGGVKWFGACYGGHFTGQQGVVPEDIVRVKFDGATGATTFTVVGTNADCNANGVTYQYIAFCDPGMQYSICGAFIHSSLKASATNPLTDSSFLPVGAFFFREGLNASATTNLIYKGPGTAGTNNGNLIDGTALTNVGSLNTGSISSLVDLHNAQAFQTSYFAFRTGNNCASVMIQAYTYTGNGAGGNRVINSTPVSGRFPLFVYVQPRNAVGWVRDPSDAGTSSRQVTGGGAGATSIVAVGIDTITVGVTLNANLIVYDVFIIPGDTAGMNNGTYYPSACLPTELVPPPDAPLPGVNVLGNGGLQLNGQVPLTMLLDVSGIYTIVPGKTNDTLYDRQSGQPSVDVKIPNPRWKTGYIGG